jgi:hypothetical protein
MRYRDSTRKIVENLGNVIWMRDKFIRHILVNYIFPLIYRRNDGIFIMKERWDNLIILDACRYDVFSQAFPRFFTDKYEFEKKTSRGSNTTTFLKENFSGKYDDIVYVTANPYVNKYLEGSFHKIVPVWKWAWDEKKQTVLPNKVYESALWAMKNYPNKKLIIHFLQPHPPFLNYTIRTKRKTKFPIYVHPVFVYKKLPTLSKDFLLKLHYDNLVSALPYVKKLIGVLNGRCIITADHGEALGEFLAPFLPIKLYGHLAGARIHSLTDVPWLVIERYPKEESNALNYRLPEFDTIDEAGTLEKLKALGYE